jgi:hypothetical protein
MRLVRTLALQKMCEAAIFGGKFISTNTIEKLAHGVSITKHKLSVEIKSARGLAQSKALRAKIRRVCSSAFRRCQVLAPESTFSQ